MAKRLSITVNGRAHRVAATANTPLLYVLRNELRLNGPRFGCGLAQCGSCSVLHNGTEIRACITPVGSVASGRITTLEGLPAMWKAKGGTRTTTGLHPVQEAWIEEQVPQCGYCQNGMMIRAVELLSEVRRPTEAQIRSAMNSHLCRCGTYPRIMKAIQRASKTTARQVGR